MKKQEGGRQTYVFLAVMCLLVAVVAAAAFSRAKSLEKIVFREHLDDTAVTVDGSEYKFRDVAFYVAYQYMETQKQAKVYDLEHTGKYWNIHTNGSFLRVEAKSMAVQMAVHDVIFYDMAVKEDAALTEEERIYMENRKADFWSDLEEEGQKRLGIQEEELEEVFLRMALAQKEQQRYADAQGVDYREYNVNGDSYRELLKTHTYEINDALWDRLDFGKITVN